MPRLAYGKYLAHIKTLLDSAALLKKTVDEQLHSYLTDGGQVPGWRLKAKSRCGSGLTKRQFA
mgnify:CR=1 FL=1